MDRIDRNTNLLVFGMIEKTSGRVSSPRITKMEARARNANYDKKTVLRTEAAASKDAMQSGVETGRHAKVASGSN